MVQVQEHHNHQVLPVVQNSADTCENSGILNFLNAPSENLVLSPPSLEPLFVFDPKLANMDRVKYRTMRDFQQRFHCKPNQFSVLKTLAQQFSLQYSLISTENNDILIALGHEAFSHTVDAISRNSLLSADVAHNVCQSNISKYHLWSILTYSHKIGRALPFHQFLLPNLTILTHCHVWRHCLRYHQMVEFNNITSDLPSSTPTNSPRVHTSEFLSFDLALSHLNAKLTPAALAELDRSLSMNSSMNGVNTQTPGHSPFLQASPARLINSEFRISRSVSYQLTDASQKISHIVLSIQYDTPLSCLLKLDSTNSLLCYIQHLQNHFTSTCLFSGSNGSMEFHHYDDMKNQGKLTTSTSPIFLPANSTVHLFYLNSSNPASQVIRTFSQNSHFGLEWYKNSCWFDSVCMLIMCLCQFFDLDNIVQIHTPLYAFLSILSCQYFPEFTVTPSRTLKRQLTASFPQLLPFFNSIPPGPLSKSLFPSGLKRIALALRDFLLGQYNENEHGSFGSALSFWLALDSARIIKPFAQYITKICPHCHSAWQSQRSLPYALLSLKNQSIMFSADFHDIEYFKCQNSSCLLSYALPPFRIQSPDNIFISTGDDHFQPLHSRNIQEFGLPSNVQSLPFPKIKQIFLDFARFSFHNVENIPSSRPPFEHTFPSITSGSTKISLRFPLLVGDFDTANLKGFILGLANVIHESFSFPIVFDGPVRYFGLVFSPLSIDLSLSLTRQVLTGCRFHLKQAFVRSSRSLPIDRRRKYLDQLSELISVRSKSRFFNLVSTLTQSYPQLSNYILYWSKSFFRLLAFKSFQTPRLGFSQSFQTTNYSESFHRQLRSLRTRNLPVGYFFIILSRFHDHFSVLYSHPTIGYHYGSSFLATSRSKRPRPSTKSSPLNRVLFPSEIHDADSILPSD